MWIGAGVVALLGFFGWFLWGGHQPPLPDKPELPAAPTPLIQQPVARSSLPRMAPLPTEEAPAKAEPPTAVVTNAADFYRKAFALYDALSKEEKGALGDWKSAIDADQAAQLCEKIRPTCDLMHQAAALTNCDWGIGPTTEDRDQLDMLTHCRALARTATWNAAHCRADNAAGATDDLLATLQMGQNLSQFALVGFLIETAIQELAAAFVAENASRFAGAEGDRLIRAFNDSLYEEDVYSAIEQEAKFVSRLALLDAPDGHPELTRLAELEREYAKVLTQPEAQYQAWLQRMQAAQATNPLVKEMWPAIENVVDKARATVVQHAMVSAGLTVLRDGPDALSTYPDPATGKPFLYQETADGFQLQSVYQRRGEPVTLLFRRQGSGGR